MTRLTDTDLAAIRERDQNYNSVVTGAPVGDRRALLREVDALRAENTRLHAEPTIAPYAAAPPGISGSSKIAAGPPPCDHIGVNHSGWIDGAGHGEASCGRCGKVFFSIPRPDASVPSDDN